MTKEEIKTALLKSPLWQKGMFGGFYQEHPQGGVFMLHLQQRTVKLWTRNPPEIEHAPVSKMGCLWRPHSSGYFGQMRIEGDKLVFPSGVFVCL